VMLRDYLTRHRPLRIQSIPQQDKAAPRMALDAGTVRCLTASRPIALRHRHRLTRSYCDSTCSGCSVTLAICVAA
jgi:hypothetical protein